ncbi:dihydropteroate synthase [Schaalia vaccimaxillae]|uniref:dihydropteroate synthase n=1 Tax=Schaalia vaccimaxillae TaxID=183916 RepID=UPI0003B31B56
MIPQPLMPSGLTLPELLGSALRDRQGRPRTAVMGILNVTPDSFSDGGRWSTTDAAVAHAMDMAGQGAAIIDIGGESTRPGSTRIDEDEEWRRIGPVIDALVAKGIVVSVDTLHAATARRAGESGASIINDVSGGMWDEGMNEAVAESGCAYVIQHYRALPGMPGESFDYGDDVVGTLLERMRVQVDAALEAGVKRESIIIDPGLGFSLNPTQCWTIVEQMDRLNSLGFPVLIGASRKRFIAETGEDRDLVTARISAQCASQGMWAVRVHNVAGNARAIVDTMEQGGED